MNTIRFKLLLSLFLVLSLAIGATLYGLWKYESQQLIIIARKEAMRAGRTIEKSLRASMLKNDRESIQRSINEISQIVEPQSRITIVGINGVAGFSSDPSFVGQYMDRNNDSSCTGCHTDERIVPKTNAIMLDSKDGPLLRNVVKIVNHPECFPCHDAEDKNLGILLYDAFFMDTFNMLRTIALRIIFTGIGSFLLITTIVSYLLRRLVYTPIDSMVKGFREIGSGNFDHWLELDYSDEFREMADSFNIMNRAMSRYINEVKAKKDEISALYNIVNQISKTIDWGVIKKVITNMLHDIFQTEKTVLIIPCENDHECFDVVWHNFDVERINYAKHHLDNGKFPCAFLSKTEFDNWYLEKFTQPRYLDHGSRVMIPLIFNDRQLGIVCIGKNENATFSNAEQKLIPAISSHISISLANARLYYIAITDSLTRLYTKRFLFETLEKLEDTAREEPSEDTSFSLLMMDLDDFKAVNDTYGHPVGDAILIQLADVLRESIRYGDLPFRYGGEEFVVILTKTDSQGKTARMIAERIRNAVEKNVFSHPDCLSLRKTISIGFSCCPTHGINGEELVKNADLALYAAKKNGKNQVRGPA